MLGFKSSDRGRNTYCLAGASSLTHTCAEFRKGENKCKTMIAVGKIVGKIVAKFQRPVRRCKKPALFSLSETAAREGKAVTVRSPGY